MPLFQGLAESMCREVGETPQRMERWMAGLDECPT